MRATCCSLAWVDYRAARRACRAIFFALDGGEILRQPRTAYCITPHRS